MSIYMKAKFVSGSVNRKDYKDWIELDRINWSLARHITQQVGAGQNRESSRPGFSELFISKQPDQSTIELFQYSLGSKSINEVEIHYCPSMSDKALIEYTLNDVIISQVEDDIYGVDSTSVIEQYCLSFMKFRKTVNMKKSNNSSTGRYSCGYNLNSGCIA